MAQELTLPANFGPLADVFREKPVVDKLAEGISAGYGIIGYKGKVWSIRYRGDSKDLMRSDGDGPVGSIECVIVESADHLSKIFYEAGWVDGNTQAPDCFSNDAITPDVSAPKKQNAVCATCPKNAWGSATNKATGGKGKACGDFKRTAVVPLQDVENDSFGGPMLLRIPAASLQDAAMYAKGMANLGYPTPAIGTKIAFDAKESYPKFTFSAIRPLTNEEAKIVQKHREGDIVPRILAETTADVGVNPQSEPATAQVTQTTVQAVPPAQVVQPQPAVVVAPAPAPVAPAPKQEVVASGFGGVMKAPAGEAPASPLASAPAAASAPVVPSTPPTTNGTSATTASPSEEGAGATGADAFDKALEDRMNALMPALKT